MTLDRAEHISPPLTHFPELFSAHLCLGAIAFHISRLQRLPVGTELANC